jgi:hypothetical protein
MAAAHPAVLAVTVALAVSLAGCAALPAAHPPPDLPEPVPRVLCASDWNGSTATVTVVGGHAITADRAVNLSVAGTAEGTTLWASTAAPGAARGSFPVDPGDSLTVAVDPGAEELRLTVSSPDGAGTLCDLRRGGPP